MIHNAPSYDIRWQQRLGNFLSALAQLDEAVQLRAQRPLSNLEQQGLIIAQSIAERYLGLFQDFAARMEALMAAEYG
jgi:hypothetical protein